MEQRLIEARERLRIALENHTAFDNGSIAASRPLGAADGRGKASATTTYEKEDLVNPKFLKTEPSNEWKGPFGKPHKAHASATAFCTRASWISWRLLDVLRESAEADPAHADERELVKDVKLQKLIPLEVSIEKEETIKVKKPLQYLLNAINEYSTRLFLRHVHGHTVADHFAGDDLFGVDLSLPIQERVKKMKKQVTRDRAQATLAAAAREVSGGGRKGGRGRGSRKHHQQQQHQQKRHPYNNGQQFGGRGGGGGGNGGSAVGGVVGGATGGYQPPVCYGFGASGHIQRNCPNKPSSGKGLQVPRSINPVHPVCAERSPQRWVLYSPELSLVFLLQKTRRATGLLCQCRNAFSSLCVFCHTSFSKKGRGVAAP